MDRDHPTRFRELPPPRDPKVPAMPTRPPPDSSPEYELVHQEALRREREQQAVTEWQGQRPPMLLRDGSPAQSSTTDSDAYWDDFHDRQLGLPAILVDDEDSSEVTSPSDGSE